MDKINLSSFEFKQLEKNDQFIFDCGNNDLNEFFNKDAILHKKELIGVTYIFFNPKDKCVICFFTVSNDAIKVTGSFSRRQAKSKRYPFYPAVKIGRLGVNKQYQNNGIGSQLMDFIKWLFTYNNKTGCRFLIVDAYNKEDVIYFYTKNDFTPMQKTTIQDDETVLLKCDLILYRNTLEDRLKEANEQPSFSLR